MEISNFFLPDFNNKSTGGGGEGATEAVTDSRNVASLYLNQVASETVTRSRGMKRSWVWIWNYPVQKLARGLGLGVPFFGAVGLQPNFLQGHPFFIWDWLCESAASAVTPRLLRAVGCSHFLRD